MKIPKISTITSGLKQYVRKVDYKLRPNSSFQLSENCDTFCREDYNDFIHNINTPPRPKKYLLSGIDLINIIPGFNQEIYKALDPEAIKALRGTIPSNFVRRSVLIENAAQIIKNIFDNKFGKDNYVFISVGRSLSATAKCLEYLGVESKHIPFSGAHGFSSNIDSIIKQPEFNKYVEFLKSQGLEDKSKKHIFCDYCASGKTLKTFKKLIASSEVGLKSDNNIFININKVLENPENSKFLQFCLLDILNFKNINK